MALRYIATAGGRTFDITAEDSNFIAWFWRQDWHTFPDAQADRHYRTLCHILGEA